MCECWEWERKSNWIQIGWAETSFIYRGIEVTKRFMKRLQKLLSMFIARCQIKLNSDGSKIHISINGNRQILSEKLYLSSSWCSQIFLSPTKRNESKRKKIRRIVWQLFSEHVCVYDCAKKLTAVRGWAWCESTKKKSLTSDVLSPEYERCGCVGVSVVTVISDLWTFVDTWRSLFPTTDRSISVWKS